MLTEWLKTMPLSEFTSNCLGKKPVAMPSSAAGAIPMCNWRVLEQILQGAQPKDALVVQRGQLSERPLPKSMHELRELFRAGDGLVIRRAQLLTSELASLGNAMAAEVGGTAQLQLFATPAGVHGFGWHFDAEEVFIVQTEGAKTYYFRENTVAPDPLPNAHHDFSAFYNETSPLMSCTLQPGDWLYLPLGWWHMAQPKENSLSISIGLSATRK